MILRITSILALFVAGLPSALSNSIGKSTSTSTEVSLFEQSQPHLEKFFRQVSKEGTTSTETGVVATVLASGESTIFDQSKRHIDRFHRQIQAENRQQMRQEIELKTAREGSGRRLEKRASQPKGSQSL